jgi:hypothetical protein
VKRPTEGDAVFQKRLIRLAMMAALALCLGACSDDPSSPAEDVDTVADYVAGVSVGDTPGTLQTSAIPRPTSGGPALSINGHLTIVNGGTATMSITSPDTFDRVYVAGSIPVSGLFVPVSGYFEVQLPAPTNATELLILFPQTLPNNDFELYFAAADPAGNVGTLRERSVHALVVGTGDVQVTVSWDTDADVDLHVVDPGANEIFWAARTSPTGGELDLDSNAACVGDNVRNENITWAVGTAPQGTYTVRVDYWSNCGATETRYTVLINNGGDIAIYHGTFTGSGDSGGFGSGVLIDTFTRTTGPVLSPAMIRSTPVPAVGPTKQR